MSEETNLGDGNADSMFIGLEDNCSNTNLMSLQDAFLKFRESRQMKIATNVSDNSDEETQHDQDDEKKMVELRKKFLDQCLKYTGVPYKRKYHAPGSKEYKSNIFLDCCGLVRRALLDLRKDFGFRIGPWNQAYMLDTLPLEIEEENMQPGDLVFISGIYFNKSFKKQPHDMVHVEVWMGDGPKTVGARWHKGLVQVFDSYQFESTSYHSMTYHFRSIDTWLKGICKSFCKRHPWKRRRRSALSKKSIFSRNVSPNFLASPKRKKSPSSSKSHSSESSSGRSNDDSEPKGDYKLIDASEEEGDEATHSGKANYLSPTTKRKLNMEFTREVNDEYDDFDASLMTPIKELDLAENTCNWNNSYSKAVDLLDSPTDQEQPSFLPPLPLPKSGHKKSSRKPFYIFTNKQVNDAQDGANQNEAATDVTPDQSSCSYSSSLD